MFIRVNGCLAFGFAAFLEFQQLSVCIIYDNSLTVLHFGISDWVSSHSGALWPEDMLRCAHLAGPGHHSVCPSIVQLMVSCSKNIMGKK